MSKKIVINSIVILFIALFLYTGISKLVSYTEFNQQLRQSPLLKPFAGWVAWMSPVAEILVVIMLVISKWRLMGLYGSFILMVLFTGYLIAVSTFSFYIPCSCGGVLEQMPLDMHIIFNTGFALLAFTPILLKNKTNT